MKMYDCQRIRDLRQDFDLNQTQVGAILGIDQRTYSSYETGKFRFPIDHLIKLALHYNTNIDYLVGLTDIRAPYPRKRSK